VQSCVIIGGGPAGLTAATYLVRFRRDALVIDDGQSRMKRIPLARNAPGFPDGIAGAELYDRMRVQAQNYGACFADGRVERLALARRGKGDVAFEVRTEAESCIARTVLIATGSKLVEPQLDDLDSAVSRALIRYCPICDGFETQRLRVAVLGDRPEAVKEALFLSRFAAQICYIGSHAEAHPLGALADEARAAGIELVDSPMQMIAASDDHVMVALQDGRALAVDTLYPSLGCAPQAGLAHELGVALAEDGGILTDHHQRTSIEGVYAAGDVLQGLDQIASACGQAAIAATAIHNDLRAREALR